ncbi:MAG: VOC family protein [Rhodothermales bacterium]|nr:VOC family protein [Rhodothermales bacterium]
MRTSFTAALLLVLMSSTAQAQEQPPWVQDLEAPAYFAVRVADMDQATRWYKQAFGLNDSVRSEADDGTWQIHNLVSGSLQVELIWMEGLQSGGRRLGIAKVGFRVADIDSVADRVEAHTGERPRIVTFEPLSQRILQLRDPEGNVIQLIGSIDP